MDVTKTSDKTLRNTEQDFWFCLSVSLPTSGFYGSGECNDAALDCGNNRNKAKEIAEKFLKEV